MIPAVALGSAILGYLIGRLPRRRAGSSSPISSASPEQWEIFVASMAVADKSHVGRQGRLGTFQMDARRLTDVGAMTRAWKGRRGTDEGAWLGEWAEGLTEAAFLGSMPLQYAVFVRSMRAAAPKVSRMVGLEVDGQAATLSGLLGVSHAAGERGVEGWIKDPRVRKRFPATAEAFRRTNKIF